jgi:methyl-accepting chemotaxis protein
MLSLVAGSVLGFLIVIALALSALRGSMLEDREAKVRNLSQIAIGIAKDFHDRAGRGEMDDATAQAKAKETIRGLRYDQVEYFFIYTTQGVCVLLPPLPEREGKTVIDLQDSNGVPFIRRLIDSATQGGRPVYYRFPHAGATEASDKLATALAFEPWGWVVGTGLYIDDVDAQFRDAAMRFAGIGILVTLVVAAAAWRLSVHIARPLSRLSLVTERLARQDFDVDIADIGRNDEIGILGRAISVLRDGAREAQDLRRIRDDTKRREEEAQRAAVGRMAVSFEGSVKQVADTISTAAGQMQEAAQSLATLVGSASAEATTVAAAAEQASTNVQTVAAAAEELSASIEEIGRRVQDSSTISSDAVAEAGRATSLVRSLAEDAGKIGEVVSLIHAIAAQTNLLALNATIEAARAGEAGKGFAVVAGEVKNLATQTAKATSDIAQQVDAVQGATGRAVEAIEGIGATIGRISEIATAIAAAVQQQQCASAEISRNIHQAAQGTNEVTTHIGAVSLSTGRVRDTSADVLASSRRLAGQAQHLETEVTTFLGSVRAG